MSEINVGDRVWVERTVEKVFGDGYIRVNGVGEEHAIDAIPDSPALPVVARWIHDFPDDLPRYFAVVTDGRWADEDWELIERVRSLVAALGAGEEAD